MTRQFSIPEFYRSSIVTNIKSYRRSNDRTKRDFSPFVIQLGSIEIKLARHFGFCFGVENAIEIAYRAIEENPDKRVFLLSEMIHNPHVNDDLIARGVRFLQSTKGDSLIPFSELTKDDIVIVPAFGTTVELFKKLSERGIDPKGYNATCPFVERVWKRGKELAEKGYTIVIHGKHDHEETRATFSHTCKGHAGVVVRDLEQAKLLGEFVSGKRGASEFFNHFSGLTTDGFDPELHLGRIGVINQTTMLATETHAISTLLKKAVQERARLSSSSDALAYEFADTRDTLCYATTENQDAVRGLIDDGGDIALVVGGYNSSNTSHLAELLEQTVPTYYVKDAEELVSSRRVRHLDMHSGKVTESDGWLDPCKSGGRILISAGASCPDAMVDKVITRICELLGVSNELSAWCRQFSIQLADSEPAANAALPG
jgi:4-hydroxy-3-methylbut-2-en-1-yl diphosphate reductase